MNDRQRVLAERIDAMSLRERALLMAILLLLIWAAWQMLLMGPMLERRRTQAQQVETQRTQVAALNQAVQSMASEAAKDPQAEARRQLEALAEQQQEVDRSLAEATSSLIAPRDMGPVLESILGQHRGLRLRGLRSLDPEPVDVGAVAGTAPLYRHGMTIEVEGSYLDLLTFLRTLETLSWQFIWRDLQIEHGEHPRSLMRLTLQTMSFSEGWLGV